MSKRYSAHGTKDIANDRYIEEIRSSLRIRDEKAKEMILSNIKDQIIRECPRSSYGEKRRLIGNPTLIGKKLSDPRNWVIDMGTPLRPNMDIPSFFSKRGRTMIVSMFLLAIFITGALFIMDIGIAPFLIAVFTILITFWIVSTSTVNDHLGYLSLLEVLKKQRSQLEHIDMGYLKRAVSIFILFSFLLSLSITLATMIIEPQWSFLVLLICISTFTATAMAGRLVYAEGKRILME